MRTTRARLATLLAAFLTFSLAGCGAGGGGTPATAPPPAQRFGPEGFWSGLTSGGFSILGVVLENGQYWFIYYASGLLYGVVQGNASASNGNFTSTDGLDFDVGGRVTPVLVSGSYRERESLQGVLTPQAGGGSATFVAAYAPAYETPATLGAVAGLWRGRLPGGETYAINVGADGAVAGSTSYGCTFGGSIAPRPSGKAVYDVSVRFNGGTCRLGTQRVNGIAVVAGSGSAQVLYAAALNGTRSAGFMVISTR